MSEQPRLSRSEWIVATSVWRRGRASVEEVMQDLPEERTWTDPTVRGYLNRAVLKGYLKLEHEGGRVFFEPAVGYKEALKERAQDFVDDVGQGDLSTLEVVADVVDKAVKKAKRGSRGRKRKKARG